MKVGFSQIFTSIAVTVVGEWGEVCCISGVGDFEVSLIGKGDSMSAVSGGGDAVEHIDPLFDGEEEIFWGSDSHEVSGFVVGELWNGVTYDLLDFFFLFADAHSSDSDTVSGEL